MHHGASASGEVLLQVSFRRSLIRLASQGSPLSSTNNHPFQFGRYLLQHNGGIASESLSRFIVE